MAVNMRQFIEGQLSDQGLGALVAVVGPDMDSDGYYRIAIKYRINPDQHHFDDGRIECEIGLRSNGGYWNRRCIRVAIKEERWKLNQAEKTTAREKAQEVVMKQVWSSAQKELTSGRNSSGAFEL